MEPLSLAHDQPDTSVDTLNRRIVVSVIIPVWNDESSLKICLEALQRQTYPADRFEIIVVDNNSTHGMEALQAEFPRVKWLCEKTPGSYAARNRGLLHATGRIIAFTDADCIPSPAWLANGVTALESSGATIVGGKIEYLDPVGRDLNACEVMEELLYNMGDHRRCVEVLRFAVTANLITYRSVFDRSGPFDAGLKSSGDREWVQRAVANGATLKYAEGAAIQHPRRGSLRELCNKQRRVIGGGVGLALKQKKSRRELLRMVHFGSIFDSRIYKDALYNPKVKGFLPRLRFSGVILLISLISTTEKIRIIAGGQDYRD